MGISSTKYQDRPKEITFLSQAFAGKAGLEEQSHIYFLTRKLPQDAKGSSFSKAEPFVSVCVQVRANAKPASRPQGTSNSFLIYVPNSLQILKWTEGRVQRKYLTQSRQLDGYSEFSSEEQGAFTPERSRHSTWLRKGLWKMQTCCLCDPINKCTENWITWEKKKLEPHLSKSTICRHELWRTRWNIPHRSHLTVLTAWKPSDLVLAHPEPVLWKFQ